MTYWKTMEQQRFSQQAIVKQHAVRSEQQILALLDEYEKSGFTLKDFCEFSEVSETIFSTWLKKYRNKNVSESQKQNGFAKIEVTPTIIQSGPQLFAEIGNIKLYKEVSAEYLKTLLS